ESARQANHAFAALLFSQTRLAGRKHHERPIHIEIEDFISSEEAIAALIADEREDDACELRTLGVEQSVRGDVDDAILLDVARRQVRFARVEVEPLVSLPSGGACQPG